MITKNCTTTHIESNDSTLLSTSTDVLPRSCHSSLQPCVPVLSTTTLQNDFTENKNKNICYNTINFNPLYSAHQSPTTTAANSRSTSSMPCLPQNDNIPILWYTHPLDACLTPSHIIHIQNTYNLALNQPESMRHSTTYSTMVTQSTTPLYTPSFSYYLKLTLTSKQLIQTLVVTSLVKDGHMPAKSIFYISQKIATKAYSTLTHNHHSCSYSGLSLGCSCAPLDQ